MVRPQLVCPRFLLTESPPAALSPNLLSGPLALPSIVVVCFAYLITTWIDHRRRGKPLWIWRRVRRSNGTYIVGSQHILFVVMSAISSLIIIGFM